MIHKEKYYYRNAADAPLGDEFIGPPEMGPVPTQTDGKAWTFLDKFFGVADQSVNLYDRIRTPAPDPYVQTQFQFGEQARKNNMILVGGVVVVLGIIVVAAISLRK